MSRFLWGVYPYVCLSLFFVVPILRMVFRPFGWSTRASSLFNRGALGVASLCLHWGLFFLLVGHLCGLFGGVLGVEWLIVFFFWVGLVGGLLTLFGSGLALWRRWRVAEVRAMSQLDDYAVHVFILLIVGLALYQVLVQRIFGISYNASSWAASLWSLSPQPELMASASLITKLHVFLALTFFAYFPFTKLVHAWTYPLNYFVRPYQSMRTLTNRFRRRWEFRLRSDQSFLLYALVIVALTFLVVGSQLGQARPTTLAAAAAPVGEAPTPSGNELLGAPLYVSQCARCHGISGRGDGPGAASPTFAATPRDLVAGDYHFVSTFNGVASDADLRRTVRLGLPQAGMPAFSELSDAQVDSLVDVLDEMWARRPRVGATIEVSPRPARDSNDVHLGASLFQTHCVACHGPEGRGDGPAAPGLRDARGNPVRPADLAAGAVKAGREPEQLYLRIAAGIPGGANDLPLMTPFRGTLRPQEIWALVTFLEERLLPR